jgi:hypothetical protein
MPQEIEVEFPVIVTLTLPDGHGMLAEEIADVAWQLVPGRCSLCIKEDAEGEPIEFASAYTEILTDETLVDGEALHPVEGP